MSCHRDEQQFSAMAGSFDLPATLPRDRSLVDNRHQRDASPQEPDVVGGRHPDPGTSTGSVVMRTSRCDVAENPRPRNDTTSRGLQSGWMRIHDGTPVEPAAAGCCVGLIGSSRSGYSPCVSEPTTSGVIVFLDGGDVALSLIHI